MPADDVLAAALMFTDQDLAANRAGQLSLAQRTMLGNARFAVRRIGQRHAVGLVFLIVIVGTVMIAMASGASGLGGQMALGIGFSTVAAFLIFGLATRRNNSRWDSMASGVVFRAQGPAVTRTRRITGEDGVGHIYEVTIGGTRFRVAGEQVLMAFTSGRGYAAYYVGSGRTAQLLSAEPV